MKTQIGHAWLRFFGWKLESDLDVPPKFVLVAAPHTSNWDLPFMLATSYVMEVPVSWMGKHTLFTPLFGWFFKLLGGIPIDRRARHNTVRWAVEQFEQRDSLVLAVPPKGTRAKTNYWRSGFYHIALGANVPIGLGYLDFEKKTCGILGFVQPTGDVRADMDKLREMYKNVKGKHIDRQMVPRLKEEDEPPAPAPAYGEPSSK